MTAKNANRTDEAYMENKNEFQFRKFSKFFLSAAFASSMLSSPLLRADGSLKQTPEKVSQLQSIGLKPRIVVFWASLGFGHLSAARSIKTQLEAIYPESEVVLQDIREFQPQWRQKLVGWFYDFVTKNNPSGYDKWYKSYMETGATIDSIGNLPLAEKHQPGKMLKFIQDNKATMVVSTFNHCSEALIRLRDQGHLKDIPIAQVLTDYVNTPYFRRVGERLDMSFVPHKQIELDWIRDGLPAEKVKTSGIPVNPKAFVQMSKDEQAEFLRSKGLDPQIKTVVLMSGGAGVGDFPALVQSMSDYSKGEPLQIVAITAKNKKHYTNLMKMTLPANIKLQVHGLVENDEFLKYVKSADVFLTKTGGLTSSETIAIGKPVVFLDINGGQESFNSDFMSSTGMGLSTKDQKNVGKFIFELLHDEVLRQRMITAQRKSQTEMDRNSITRWIVDTYYEDAAKTGFKPRTELKIVDREGRYPERKGKAYFMDDEKEVAQARWDLIKNENKEVFAAFLLFDGNKAGRVALAAAREARRRGARVRILTDAWNMESWMDETIDRATMAALIKEGVEIRQFNPVDVTSKSKYLNPDNFKRMHDKLIYFGGQNIAATGDRNMQNINFRLQKTNGQSGKSYRSIETLIQGEVVEDIKSYMERSWNISEVPDLEGITEEDIIRANRNMDRVLKVAQNSSLPTVDWEAKLQDVESLKLLADVPGKKGIEFPIEEEIVEKIKGAKSKVVIVSPYIRLTGDLLKEIKAAKARGVKEVEILTAAFSRTDSKASSVAFAPQAKELMALGIKVSQLEGKDLLHAKAVRIDNEFSYITGHNFNGRSRFTDQESGVCVKCADYANRVDNFIASVRKESVPFNLGPTSFGRACKNKVIQFMIKVPLIGHQI